MAKIEFSGDAVIAPALSPERDEPRDGFLIFHNLPFWPEKLSGSAA